MNDKTTIDTDSSMENLACTLIREKILLGTPLPSDDESSRCSVTLDCCQIDDLLCVDEEDESSLYSESLEYQDHDDDVLCVDKRVFEKQPERCTATNFEDSKTASLLSSVPVPTMLRKRSRPVCLFVNFMGSSSPPPRNKLPTTTTTTPDKVETLNRPVMAGKREFHFVDNNNNNNNETTTTTGNNHHRSSSLPNKSDKEERFQPPPKRVCHHSSPAAPLLPKFRQLAL